MAWELMLIQQQWEDANGNPLSGGVLKAYDPGTTDSISIAITSAGGSPQASITLNAKGQYEVSGNVVLPYVDRTHKWAIFSNATDAAANSNPYDGFFDNIEQVSTLTASTYMQTMLDDTTSAEALTTLDVSTFMQAVLEDTTAAAALTTLTAPGLTQENTFTKTQIWKKGADVASATALTVGDGNYFDVTGTTTITSIATVGIGAVIKCHFDGAVLLTHHATNLILPGAANYTTAAGDEFEFTEYASGDFRVTAYALASGQAFSATLPREYFSGLETSQDTDTDHDIAIAVGECRDSTDALDIVNSSILTKKIDVDWAVGDDAGGFPSGLTLTADTWYHYYILSKADGTVDAGWDTSLTATNLLSDATGYTFFQQIASHLTDSSSNITTYFQDEDDFYWDVLATDANSITVSSTAASVTLTVPTGLIIKSDSVIWLTGTVSISLLATSLTQTDTAPSSTKRTVGVTPGDESQQSVADVHLRTNTSAQIRVRATTSSNGEYFIYTRGWTYKRGT